MYVCVYNAHAVTYTVTLLKSFKKEKQQVLTPLWDYENKMFLRIE